MKNIVIALLIFLFGGCTKITPSEDIIIVPPSIENTAWTDGTNTIVLDDMYADIQVDTLYHWNKFKTHYEYISTSGAIMFNSLNSPIDNYRSLTMGIMGRVDNDSTLTLQVVEIMYDWKGDGLYKDKTMLNNYYILKRK